MKLEQIDTSVTAGKAEVMRLAADGRAVASRPKGATSGWFTAPAAVWDWSNYNYAIIAEPVGPDEVWVFVDANGNCRGYDTTDSTLTRLGERAVRYVRAD